MKFGETGEIPCSNCGHVTGTGDQFCAACGFPLSTEPLHEPDVAPESTENRRRISGEAWAATTSLPEVPPDRVMQADMPPPQSPRRKRRRSHKAPRWHVLLPVTAALMMVFAGFLGLTYSQTNDTISKVQQVSTPAPQVSDQTVTKVETGPNEGAQVVEADEATDPNTSNSNGSSAQESAGRNDQNVAEIPAPSNTDSTGQEDGSDAQSSTNADGNSSSDLSKATDVTDTTAAESQTQSDAVISELPDPSSSDSSSASTDSTAPKQTSEASDSPLDGETQAEQQMAAGKTFDTAPAVSAMADAQATSSTASDSSSDGGGLVGGLRDRGDDLKDAAQGAAVAAGVSNADLDPMTVLVMGVDARPGSAIDIGVRPDALMVLRIDPAAGTCKGLAIPRDSYAELPGYGKTKINHALMLGGIPYEQLVVESYLDLDIDHYALIDFTGFEELVDSVGGVTIVVPPGLESPAVPQSGTVVVTGEQALRHARYRGGPDGDFGRIKRQQEIMQGLISSAAGKDLLQEGNKMLAALQDHVRTDLSIEQLVSLAKFYQSSCDVEGLQMDQIPGDVVYGPIIDPLFNLPLSYVVSDEADVRNKVNDLLDK